MHVKTTQPTPPSARNETLPPPIPLGFPCLLDLLTAFLIYPMPQCLQRHTFSTSIKEMNANAHPSIPSAHWRDYHRTAVRIPAVHTRRTWRTWLTPPFCFTIPVQALAARDRRSTLIGRSRVGEWIACLLACCRACITVHQHPHHHSPCGM